jgi:putative transposase
VSLDSVFFLTINCKHRGVSQLTGEDLPQRLFAAVSHYRDSQRWWPEIVLLMPDHLHALVSFSWEKKNGMQAVVGDWKRYTARAFGIDWQRDFFDHRIRDEADGSDKWDYIRENPVRAGLVERHDQWQHVWFPDGIGWSQGRVSA